jgi:HEAT repeat protein
MNEEAARYYVTGLMTDADEDSFFGLLDLGPVALPFLMGEADKPENKTIRARLVEVIWQYRSVHAIPFLDKALRDSDPAVWKTALDGLVAIDGPDSVQAVRMAIEDVERGTIQNGLTKEWLVEALEQIAAMR